MYFVITASTVVVIVVQVAPILNIDVCISGGGSTSQRSAAAAAYVFGMK
jgi:ribosomal protein S9